ncbi:MAG: hypothetical protein CMJ81_07370 [Planctomycetaceae bacterium]|nr:hypothetical protein [Planctomycetaceae bacterium]MBP62127.1 hypothetical protein [Planctomycetaceae bacterium]
MWSFHRRNFLGRGAALATAGAAVLSVKSFPRRIAGAGTTANGAGAEARLKELGITLGAPSQPAAPFQPGVLVDNMLYISGHGPRKSEGGFVKGRVGQTLTLEEGKKAARLTGLDILSTVRDTLGSLDRVARLVKVTGMVNSTDDFEQHPQVINGFSELMIDVFGEELGKGARSAVGMSGLPFGIAVEVEAIFQVRV